MFVVCLKKGEYIQIGDVLLKLHRIDGSAVRLAAAGPRDIPIRHLTESEAAPLLQKK